MDSVYQDTAVPVNAPTGAGSAARGRAGRSRSKPAPAAGEAGNMTVTPAQPVTEAQRARYQRMVEVAAMLVTTGGEEALQMSEMPALAEVSLSTLYRYFPSKEHLLFAVVQQHLESLLERAHPSQRAGLTVRDKVAHNLLRAFEFDQRVPTLGSVVRRLVRLSDPAFRAERQRVGMLQFDIVQKVAGPMTEHQRQVLGTVLHAASGAIESWMAGLGSASDVRFAIHTACRLLDLPPDQVDADRQLADTPK
jgi:TetR/AcrR family transcriptional regulator, cholesterol catabolism regulator